MRGLDLGEGPPAAIAVGAPGNRRPYRDPMSHRERMMEKLDIHSRTDLIKFALKRGVIRV